MLLGILSVALSRELTDDKALKLVQLWKDPKRRQGCVLNLSTLQNLMAGLLGELGGPDRQPGPRIRGLYIPQYKRQPWNNTDGSRFTELTRQFIRRQQTLLSQGWPSHVVFGTNEVDLDAVFVSGWSCAEPATVSQWIALVVKSFDLLGVPEKLGLMFILGRFLAVCRTSHQHS